MKDSDHLLDDIWTRIERVLVVHAPEVMETLAPGATRDEIAELEAGVGLKLPRDLRRSLEIHNGQRDPQCNQFCGTVSLMSTADILRDWAMLTEIAVDFDEQHGVYSPEKNSLNADWWRRSCIPFGDHGSGDLTCVDMSPEGGAVGRIVEHINSNPMEETNMPSFADWLDRVASALEAGRFDREPYGFFNVHPQFAWKWNSEQQ
jgi:cell wall assembly regulator SMI1